ncbi:hypothetical protein HMPREF9419_2027 [Prevotella nigrescens ATCC 33563]|nr:hypothetical protein HMPREF9419_2027 [Prevotella nigrescens ATCC 33563]
MFLYIYVSLALSLYKRMYFFIVHFCAFCNQAGGERADWK